jgi:hypothetical protein
MATTLPKPPQIHIAPEEDLLIARLEGDYTIDVAVYSQTFTGIMGQKYGYRLQLIDVTRAGTITPEARRCLLQDRHKTRVPGAVAIVGANFAVRTLADMVTRALKTLTKTHLGVGFFDDEKGARLWLNEQRNRLRTEAASTKLT